MGCLVGGECRVPKKKYKLLSTSIYPKEAQRLAKGFRKMGYKVRVRVEKTILGIETRLIEGRKK